jgi:hypothetical protein
LSQPTTGNQGTLAVAAQNGLNTLRFTAANSQRYQFALPILSGSTAGSMYMVYRVVSTTAANFMLDWGGGGSAANAWPYSDGNIYTDFGTNAQRACGTPTTSLSATYHIISIESATNDWAIYVDGGKGGSSGGTIPLYSVSSSTVTWTGTAPYLGAATGLSGFLDGWVAEIYFTNAKQTTADRQKNEGYLAWKWGLTGNLDPSHPYKTVAPTYAVPKISIGDGVVNGTPGSVLFVGAGSVLAQDNTNFFWDATNYLLKLGGTGTQAKVYLNSIPALYQIPNASGNNWFEAGAGNVSLTGNNNLGTGDQCLQGLTTGSNNTAIGAFALYTQMTGSGNIALGQQSLGGNPSDGYNIAIGDYCLHDLGILGGTGGTGNLAFGSQAGTHLTSGDSNIFMGRLAVQNMITGNFNTVIGAAAGANLGTSSSPVTTNTLVGYRTGTNLAGGSSYNTWLGSFIGPTGTYTSTIAIAEGSSYFLFDANLLTTNTWSCSIFGAPTGLHIYNMIGGYGVSPTNYERAILDWNPTANVFRIGYQSGGSGALARLIAIDAFSKAGAPAAADLPAGTFAFIDDTTNNQTWLVFNKAGTIRKVQLT